MSALTADLRCTAGKSRRDLGTVQIEGVNVTLRRGGEIVRRFKVEAGGSAYEQFSRALDALAKAGDSAWL